MATWLRTSRRLCLQLRGHLLMKDTASYDMKGVRKIWLMILVCVFIVGNSRSFKHRHCTRSIKNQFSFPDCFVPAMNPNLLLSEASFLMSHNAATGYLNNKQGISGATNLYAKTQIGTVYEQLEDGARALDVRPKLLANGTVICHHGTINIPVTLEALVKDAMRWCQDNPDELVLIHHLNFAYDSGLSWSTDTTVNSLSQVYQQLGVRYVTCKKVYGLTVSETMQLAALSNGGYLLVLDQRDTSATHCAKGNYVTDKLVTCYTKNDLNLPCTNQKSRRFQALKNYVLASANNAASDDSSVLGPPKSLYKYPFNIIQALWQVDTASAALGVAHVSSILDDNTKSHINAHLVDWVYDGEFNAISHLLIDQVKLNGNALLSVLRNTCGQSKETDSYACGRGVPKPTLRHRRISKLSFFLTIAMYIALGVWFMVMARHYRIHYKKKNQAADEPANDVKGKNDLSDYEIQLIERAMRGEFA